MRRLRLSLLLVVITALIGAGWAVDHLFEAMSTAPQAARTNEQVAARLLGHELAVRTLNDPLAVDTVIARADIGLEESVTLARQPRAALPVPPELVPALESSRGLALESDTGVAFWFAAPGSDSIITLDVPIAEPASARLKLALTFLFYASVIVLLLVGLSPLVRRLQALELAARAFGKGQLDTRTPTRQNSPIAELESSFNAMASRIEGLVEDNRLLSSAVSHDLKTPLARLRFGIDAALELEGAAETNTVDATTEVRRRYLNRMADNISAMESLVEVLLDYARLDRRLHELPLGPVDLVDVVERIVKRSNVVAGEPQNPAIEWHRPTRDRQVMAEERYVSMLVENLVSNAHRFAQSIVRIELVANKGTVTLQVEDDGPGISESDRARVLKPFVRLSSETQRGIPGHGLGLAIVARVAAWHNATLNIDASPELGGARVRVVFQSG